MALMASRALAAYRSAEADITRIDTEFLSLGVGSPGLREVRAIEVRALTVRATLPQQALSIVGESNPGFLCARCRFCMNAA